MSWLRSLFGRDGQSGPRTQRAPLDSGQTTYNPASGAPTLPAGRRDERVVETVVAHLERHLGSATVMSDPSERATKMPIDLVIVAPTEEQPLWTVVTAGMSARPMHAPAQFHDDRFAELLIRLPAEWPMPDLHTGDASAWADPAACWPIYYLDQLALLPHTYRTWFGLAQTVGSEDEAQPIAPGVEFTGALFLNPVTVAIEGFDRFHGPHGDTNLLNVLPLFPEELEYKRRHGLRALLDLAGDFLSEVGIVDPTRPSILDLIGPDEGEAV